MGRRPKKKKPASRRIAPSTSAKLRRLSERTLELRREVEGVREELQVFQDRDEPAFQRWVDENFPEERALFKSLSRELMEEEALYQSLERLSWMGKKADAKFAEQLRRDIRESLDADPEWAEPDLDEDFEIPDEFAADEAGEAPSDDDDAAVPDPCAGRALSATRGSASQLGDPDEDGLYEELLEAIPPELFDFLFESFFREAHGIAPDEADPEILRRARAEFRAGFVRLCTGDDERGFEHLMRSAADTSPAGLAEIKTLYRRLTRALHPDRAETFGEDEKRLWNEIQAAYRYFDLEGLRSAEVTLLLLRDEEIPPAKAPVLRRMLSALEEERDALQEEIDVAREHPAWRFTRKRGLATLAKRVALDLKRAISDYRQSLLELRAAAARFIRPRPARRRQRQGGNLEAKAKRATAKNATARKAPARKAAAKPSSPPPKAEPNSTGPVQLEFPF